MPMLARKWVRLSMVSGGAWVWLLAGGAAHADRADGRRLRHPHVERYTVVDLGDLGGAGTFATSINERGQVAGAGTTAGGAQHAFFWERGTITDVGALNGPGNASFPSALNDRGQIVGFSGPIGQNGHAFLWDSGRLTDLDRSRHQQSGPGSRRV
jgi:probable HAF family extracellular repeat protein